MHSWRDELNLLRVPGVGLLFAGRTVNMLGLAFAPVALAFGILDLPAGNAGLLSVVMAAEAIPLIVFMLVGGALSDRLPRERVLMVSQLLASVAYAALATLIGLGVADPWVLGAAAVLSGIGGAMGYPALTGMIPQIVPEDRLQDGNALLSFGVSIARIVGVVAAGAVTVAVGGAGGLAVSSAMYAGTAVIAWRLRPRRTATREESSSLLADMRAGWKEFTAHEWLWVVVAQWSLLIMCFNAAHEVLGPVIAKESYGGAQAWSRVLAGEAVGELVGVLVALRWHPRHPILAPVIATTVALPVPFVLLGLGAPLPAVMVAALPMGVAFMLFDVLWTTTMQREVPHDALSRVSSYDAMGSFLLGPVGLLIAGPAVQHFGSRLPMLVCGLLLVVIAAAALVSRDVRRLQWTPLEPAQLTGGARAGGTAEFVGSPVPARSSTA